MRKVRLILLYYVVSAMRVGCAQYRQRCRVLRLKAADLRLHISAPVGVRGQGEAQALRS
jgi:hypothetical protein